MKKQTICLALSPCVIAGYLLANNMFSHKQQLMQNENIVSYSKIMIKNEISWSANVVEVEPVQGVSGIDTYDFSDLKDIKQCKKETKGKEEKKKDYSEKDLMLLAGIVQNEAGSNFCTNYHQRCIGSVVLNRVKSDYFPDSIEDVILQKGQYAIDNKALYNPSKRAIKNARYVLENGSILPEECVFQAEFKQGDYIYDVIETPISTTYICGKN